MAAMQWFQTINRVNNMNNDNWGVAIAELEETALKKEPSVELLTDLREYRNLYAVEFSRKLRERYNDNFEVRLAEVIELAKAGRKEIAVSLCTDLLQVFNNCHQCQIKLRWERILCEVRSGRNFEFLDDDFIFLWIEFSKKKDNSRMQAILVRYIISINSTEAIGPLRSIMDSNLIESDQLKRLILRKIEELVAARPILEQA